MTRATARTHPTRGPVAGILILLIEAYRRGFSWWLPSRCRFYPSCSAYALEAIRVHGAPRGARLAVARVLRCHPFHPGGIDPVPRSKSESPR